MNLRHKRNYTRLESMQSNFQPVIGLLNTAASLNCQVHPESHRFNIDLMHPLQIINKINQNLTKLAFDRIVATTFDIKIQQRNTFIPEALLAGDSHIIHEYKKMIERSRIGAYIKMNIKHQEKSYEKKKLISLDLRTKVTHHSTERHQINLHLRAFNETNINKKQTNISQNYLTINTPKPHYASKISTPLTPNKHHRSFTMSRPQNSRINQENTHLNINIEQHSQFRAVNHTQIHNIKKTSSNKKSRGVDGIKVNYIAFKGSQQNPETSTFIYKSTTQKTNQQRSQFDAKTSFNAPHMIHFDKTIDNDISFSVNDTDKFSVQSKVKEIDDNLSEQFEKSMKNSEISELTHREMYSKDYFGSDQKILKKGRKVVEL